MIGDMPRRRSLACNSPFSRTNHGGITALDQQVSPDRLESGPSVFAMRHLGSEAFPASPDTRSEAMEPNQYHPSATYAALQSLAVGNGSGEQRIRRPAVRVISMLRTGVSPARFEGYTAKRAAYTVK